MGLLPVQPTPAVVVRMETRQLVACVVNLNWTEDVLLQNCGRPT